MHITKKIFSHPRDPLPTVSMPYSLSVCSVVDAALVCGAPVAPGRGGSLPVLCWDAVGWLPSLYDAKMSGCLCRLLRCGDDRTGHLHSSRYVNFNFSFPDSPACLVGLLWSALWRHWAGVVSPGLASWAGWSCNRVVP